MTSLFSSLIALLRQPTSVAGLSTLMGTAIGVATGGMKWPVAAPVIAGAVMAIVMPDNTTVKQDAASLAADLFPPSVPTTTPSAPTPSA